jgi:hypothetical protein
VWIFVGLAVLSTELVEPGALDWTMLHQAGSSLFGSDGLHVYADMKSLQAGPVSVAGFGALGRLPATFAHVLMHTVMWVIGGWSLWRAARVGGPGSRLGGRELPSLFVGGLAGAAFIEFFLNRAAPSLWLRMLLPAVWLAGCALIASRRVDGRPRSTMQVNPLALAALLTIPSWAYLAAATAHVDDAAAIGLLVWAALAASKSKHPVLVAVMVGLAIACKPWAIVGLGFPPWRGIRSLRDQGLALGIAAACWLPFVLADRRTLGAGSRAFAIAANSSVHLLGLQSMPPWLRTVQLAAALAVAVVAGHRRGPLEALAAGMAVRLLLDPGTFPYYLATVVLAFAVLDLAKGTRLWRTSIAIVGLYACPLFLPGPTQPLIRTAVLLTLIALCVMRVDVFEGLVADRWSVDARRRLPSWLTRTAVTSKSAARPSHATSAACGLPRSRSAG